MARVIDLQSGKDFATVQIAHEVAEDEDFSSVLIKSSMDGILSYDFQGRLTLWNPQMEKMTGMKSSEVLGRRALEIFPYLRDVGLDQHYVQTLAGRTMRSGVTPFTIPQTGHQGYSEQQSFPLFDEQGRVTGGLAIVRDLTEMKQKFDTLCAVKHALEGRVRDLENQLQLKTKLT